MKEEAKDVARKVQKYKLLLDSLEETRNPENRCMICKDIYKNFIDILYDCQKLGYPSSKIQQIETVLKLRIEKTNIDNVERYILEIKKQYEDLIRGLMQ